MSLVIRLTKTGKKGEGKYRLVVKEKRSKRDGKAIEFLGFFEKTATFKKNKINRERLNYWLSCGAKPSSTVATLMKDL